MLHDDMFILRCTLPCRTWQYLILSWFPELISISTKHLAVDEYLICLMTVHGWHGNLMGPGPPEISIYNILDIDKACLCFFMREFAIIHPLLPLLFLATTKFFIFFCWNEKRNTSYCFRFINITLQKLILIESMGCRHTVYVTVIIVHAFLSDMCLNEHTCAV